jgi:hypothetical protein
VCSIVLIITLLLLVRQSKFNSATLLRSLAYSVALSVRQAQVYGSSVRGFVASGSTVSQFASGYGVYYTTADLTRYNLFADLNNNGQMDSSPTDERLSPYTIARGYQIRKFCGILASDGVTQVCSDTGTISSLGVYFRRPSTDACFSSSVSPAACAAGAASVYSSAYIQLVSTGGTDTRSVKITTSGQITVCSLNVDPPTC